jgi:hypothetical protein
VTGFGYSAEFESIPAMFVVYGEPCSNCTRYLEGAFCELRHRQREVSIGTGHIPAVTVRRRGGCPDHNLKEGTWWGEDPIKPHQSGYGGSSTNILI